MRLFVFASALALATGYQADIGSQVNGWLGVEEDPRVQAAIQLRCESGPTNLHRTCAQELEHEFASGAREPEAIVRRHCTRFSNEWTVEIERPLPICTELYGGWIEG